jgi:hypothetical protein
MEPGPSASPPGFASILLVYFFTAWVDFFCSRRRLILATICVTSIFLRRRFRSLDSSKGTFC